ncbi:MAG: LacI family transcriptional regulator [Acidobacteria bacterium]|nr:LacI family transcriptional regulator [Acidobacteriota bacterium]
MSRQTISNAINAPDRLRPATLHKVLQAIEELGYRPSHAARSLRTHATNVIGCRLLPSSHSGTGGVLDGWFHALCAAARSGGYDVLAFAAATDDEEIEVYDDLLRRRAVDGIILTNTHYLDPRPAWLLQHEVPFVAFGRPWGSANATHSWVDVDGASGTADAVRHLADLGHTRIGFLGLNKGSGVCDDRFQGWASAMRALGLATTGLVGRAEDGIASGRALTEKLLDGPRPPTGLVCVSDSMAVGAIRAVEDRGWIAGRDLAIVGFDDSPIASLLRPSLSSVRQPIVAVAGELVSELIAELSGVKRRPSRILRAPRLIVRESSGDRLSTPEITAFDEAPGPSHSVLARRSHFDTKSQQTPERIKKKGA